MIAKLLLILVFISSCATKVPESVTKQIHADKIAGYWMIEGYNGKKNFARISCDGEIDFDFTDHNQKFFNEDKDQGKIILIRNDEMDFKSWTSTSRQLKYQKPVEIKDGCWKLNLNGFDFKGEPDDCSKPKASLAATFQEAMKNKPSKCYK